MSEPIRYTLTFPAPETHCVEVEASVPTDGEPFVDLMLPVWTPGSYKVRDYARHLEGIRAESAGGNPLEVVKTSKSGWRVTTWGARRVLVSYRVYCRELTVRTNFVDRSFGLLNGAATFLTRSEDASERRHEVDVVLRSEWSQVVTFLRAHPSGGPHRFSAPNYDRLVDSPIYVGSPSTYHFEVGGVGHTLVNDGGLPVWDGRRAHRDLQRIVRTECELWGTIPYSSYTFLNLIQGGRDGLEHAEGSVLMTEPYSTSTRKGYLEWLSLAAHEHFHAWNGKRLRPVELGPFDYQSENYTRSIWVVEGVTSYYDDLIVHRAGLSTREEYLAAISKRIECLQTTPGRRVRSLEEASLDAWIKLYQPDENSVNSTISYYVKGAVVAFLLDAQIRRATADARSLDDVLRVAYRRYAGERGFEPSEFEALASEIADVDLSAFFELAVRGTEELPYLEALEAYGLEFVSAPSRSAPRGDEAGWLGAEVRQRGGRFVVQRVPRGTPAHRDGLAVDDELIATDGFRLAGEGLSARLQAYRPGDRMRLTLARRDRLLELDVTVEAPPQPAWLLTTVPSPTAEQSARLDAWLATPASSR